MAEIVGKRGGVCASDHRAVRVILTLPLGAYSGDRDHPDRFIVIT
jgi:hypothetical protein